MSDVLARAEKALVALNASELVALYADRFVFEDVPGGRLISDRAELEAYFGTLFSLPEVSFTEVSFFACGSQGAGAWTWSGASPGSGQPYAVRGVSLFELSENHIKKETIFYDPRAVLA